MHNTNKPSLSELPTTGQLLKSTVLAAGVVDLATRPFWTSPGVGEWVAASIILKFLGALISFYATLGMIACVGVLATWLIT